MLNKLSVGTKVAGGFAMLLLIFAVSSGITYYSVRQVADISATLERVSRNALVSAEMEGALERRISSLRGYLLTGKDKERTSYEKAKQDFSERMDDLRSGVRSEEGKQLLAKDQQASQNYAAATDHVAELRTANRQQEAVDLYFSPQVSQLRAELHDAITAQAAHEDKKREQAREQLEAVEARIRNVVAALGIVGLVLGAAVAFFLGRWFSGSVHRILGFAVELRQNNLAIADLRVASTDEVGQTLETLNAMKNNLHKMIQSIRGMAEQVAAASEELSATSQQITANSEETTAQAKVVSEAGGQVNTNLQTLSSGAEEMTSTIGEIAKNATEAARVAGEAVEAAESANQTVSKLGDSSVEIAKVIEVITSIAQQTNLLALNATIEAARAGEAGKGFAVVANEVKELAKQTAKATEEIKQKITVIRENTGGAVEAIGGIKAVIDKVSHISTVIATAVEEQSATTSEMARNVTEAAQGASTISSNIKGVADAAQNTSTNVGEAQTATEHLAKMANQLRDLVGQFKVGESSTKQDEPPAMKAARHAAGAR